LGGFLEEPVRKALPTLAPASLPPVGGYSMKRSPACNVEEIVSCSSAFTRVSSHEDPKSGSLSILVTAVVEDLNILDVVRAARVVAQLTIVIPAERGPIAISLAGSGFQGLAVAGHPCAVAVNPILRQESEVATGTATLTHAQAYAAGALQAESVLASLKSRGDEDLYQWGLRRHGWMTAQASAGSGGTALCSLVDGLQAAGPARAYGHIVEIPQFGRFVFGELLLSAESAQFTGIRAELGCPVTGRIGASVAGGGGTGDN
jgi:hypothetical protein